ncbi:MAG: CoA ester lyase [Gammaproteobacteria bacterium]|nr:CoA ester lyase [Gammaproteobacteria bacterium]
MTIIKTQSQTPDTGSGRLGRRSLLFVPGSRIDRVTKALESEADAVIIDLEDAVAPGMKNQARAEVLEFLKQRGREGSVNKELFVRINAIRSSNGMRDLLALAEEAKGCWDAIVVPKADTQGDIRQVADILDEHDVPGSIAALIESLEGLDNINQIAAASERMDFLMFGGADFAADLGVAIERLPLEHARCRVIHAAARFGLASVEMPWINLSDKDGYEDDLKYCFKLGFDARAAIHPDQIAGIHRHLLPTPEGVSKAREIVRAFEEADGGVFAMNGRLVEKPVVMAARKALARAGRAAGGA